MSEEIEKQTKVKPPARRPALEAHDDDCPRRGRFNDGLTRTPSVAYSAWAPLYRANSSARCFNTHLMIIAAGKQASKQSFPFLIAKRERSLALSNGTSMYVPYRPGSFLVAATPLLPRPVRPYRAGPHTSSSLTELRMGLMSSCLFVSFPLSICLSLFSLLLRGASFPCVSSGGDVWGEKRALFAGYTQLHPMPFLPWIFPHLSIQESTKASTFPQGTISRA